MDIPFVAHWRGRRSRRAGAVHPETAEAADAATVAQLLSECELLREQARRAGVELDDTPDSLGSLDQLPPRWREDPEVAPWLGTDAGLYLGTVLVRTVPGARWRIWPGGRPVVRLPAGRDLDVLDDGSAWAQTGTPELSQLYAEASEGADGGADAA